MSGSIIREKPTFTGPARQDSVNSKYKTIEDICIYYYNFDLDGSSPLKLFTHAKTTITEIFKNIAIYVNDSNKFLDGLFN